MRVRFLLGAPYAVVSVVVSASVCGTDSKSSNLLLLPILFKRPSYDFNSWCHGHETAQKIYEHLDSVTGAEMSRYYIATKKLLLSNRAFLETLIENLADKKLLSYKDIAKIREDVNLN